MPVGEAMGGGSVSVLRAKWDALSLGAPSGNGIPV